MGGRAVAQQGGRAPCAPSHREAEVARRCAEFCAGPSFIGFALLGLGACGSLVVLDVNPLSVAAARETVRRNGLGDRVSVYHSDGLDDVPASEKGSWDLVVSNPPYVTTDSPELADEVREFEPAEALFAPDGDADFWVRALLDSASDLIAPGGLLFIELGFDQSERVRALCAERGVDATVHADLAGTDRVLEVRY